MICMKYLKLIFISCICLSLLNIIAGQENNDQLETTTDESESEQNSPTEAAVEEKKEYSEITIAEHLRQDPTILESFKPSALRNVVNNPKSLSILPISVLDKIMNDPIFSVNLPPSTLNKITELIQNINEENAPDADEDYDYYDVDFGDDELNNTVTSFIGDLDPEFLRTIDPDIIVEYFENASPEDLQAIMTNSSILLSLPSATVGSLLGKLDQDVLIQLLQSPAVRELYNTTTRNVSQEQRERIMNWQIDVAEHIINGVHSDVLVQLPEEIVKTQLNNTRALRALLKHPDKLEALVNTYAALLNDLNPEIVLELAIEDPDALAKIETPIFIQLASCPVVRRLSEELTADQVIRDHTDKFVAMITTTPTIIDCISDENLEEFVVKTFDDARYLDMQNCRLKPDCESLIGNLTDSILLLKDSSILRLAEKQGILFQLPDVFIIDVINRRPQLISELNKESVIGLAKRKPWLVGEFMLVPLMRLIQREEVLMGLTDRDLGNLLAFQPGILSVLTSLPTDKMVMFLAVHIDLLDLLQPSAIDGVKRILQNKELIRAIPTELHAKMAKKPVIVNIMDKFTLLDVLESHPYVITRLTEAELKPYLRFLYGEWFRDRLPCPTVRVSVKHPDFLNKLPTDLLSKVITSRHILSCIERPDLEQIIVTSDIGSRLSLSTLMITARNLRLSQISLRIAMSFLSHQVPRSNPLLFFN